ncbi:MAG: hypothetical protein HY319_27655 [Armatimonadetes bacterium]|nr:hypothetical protein [Armatimonadota bacterium]
MRRRGFMMVLCLLMLTLLLVAGMALHGSQAAKYRGAVSAVGGVQAKAAALSGMDDARLKLAKDVRFPPKKGKEKGQIKFAYSENLRNPATTPEPEQVGYTVVVDYSDEVEVVVPPFDQPVRYGIYKITSIGLVGPRDRPIAQRILYAEWDIERGRFIRFDDHGSL